MTNSLKLVKFYISVFPWLFPATIALNLMSAGLNKSLEGFFKSSAQPMGWFFILIFATILVTLIYPVFLAAFCLKPYQTKFASMPDFLRNVSQPLVIESLRSWGKVLRWSFLFLLPGAVMFYRMTYVPLVATLSNGYRSGSVDALEQSADLTKKAGLTILWAAMFQFLIPLMTTVFLDSYRDIETHWIGFFIASWIDSILMFLSFHFLYLIVKEILE